MSQSNQNLSFLDEITKILSLPVVNIIIGSILAGFGSTVKEIINTLRESEKEKRDIKESIRKAKAEFDEKEINSIKLLYDSYFLISNEIRSELTTHENNLNMNLSENFTQKVLQLTVLGHQIANRANFSKLKESLDEFASHVNIFSLDKINFYIYENINKFEEKEINKNYARSLAHEEEERIDGLKRIAIIIDTDFRREVFIKGKEILLNYTFQYEWKDFTSNQREILVKAFFDLYKSIPDIFYLPFPKIENSTITNFENWVAKIDFTESSPVNIIKLWESEVENEFKLLEK